MEIEAKFSVPDRATFDRLCQLKSLAGYRLEPAGVKQVQDRYLDTDSRAILRAGYACRVRHKTERSGSSAAQETLIAALKGLGGAGAVSGVHRRAEYELQVDDDVPETWPDSPARRLALQLSGGQALRELLALSQVRHQRLVYAGARLVAEMSLDVVTLTGLPANEEASHPYYEMEVELLDRGNESDLNALASELRATWDLRPEPRSKFERGLELVGGAWGHPMEGPLTKDERTALQTWIETGNAPQQRRARIILLHDEGQDSRAIAQEIGLSARQVRRWLTAFREDRMGIFPRTLPVPEKAASSELPTETEPPPLAEPEPEAPPPLTLDELCARHDVDVVRAEHVKDLALQLFELTAGAHSLPAERQATLSAAATLHNLGLGQDPARRHLAGSQLILAQPIADLDPTEQDVLASLVAFHRKKVRPRRCEAFVRLPEATQGETLALAALLRVAVALDASKSQSSTIRRLAHPDDQQRGQPLTLVVEGAAAHKDAAAARRRADLWRRLFDVRLNFVTAEQLVQVPLTAGVETEPLPVPELAAPGLLPDDAMSEAGRKTLWFHFLRMLKHEPGTRAGEDIEELHDMRVATRRMRAALRVFGEFYEPGAMAPFNKALRRVARALGYVRDLDVFEEKAGHYLQTLPEAARDGLDPLIESWHGQREGMRERMMAFLDGKRYQKFKREFGAFLQTEGAGAVEPVVSQEHPVPFQVRHVAPRLIYTRYETVRAYETVLDNAQIETLHALRIDCKYLRYTLEFLREVLGPEVEDVITEVKAMQDHLGDLNDAEVAINILNEFLEEWDALQTNVPLIRRRSTEGIVTYLASRHAEKHRLVTTFPQAWARLNRQEVRRGLALAVAAL
ncbi:MAG: CHAD domain-containing protein [Anaerolineae bacterium]|jgi:CHAD domain-containing protein